MTSTEATQALQHSGSASQPTMSSKPFPLLSLPPELRLMVYEEYVASLTIDTKRHEIRRSDLRQIPGLKEFWPTTKKKSPRFIRLNRLSISLDLLYTCRLIHNEAASLFDPLLRELSTKPMSFDVSTHAEILALTTEPSPLLACVDRDICFMGTLPAAAEKFVNLCRRPPASYTPEPVHTKITIITHYDDEGIDGVHMRQANNALWECVQDIGRECKIFYWSKFQPTLDCSPYRETTILPPTHPHSHHGWYTAYLDDE